MPRWHEKLKPEPNRVSSIWMSHFSSSPVSKAKGERLPFSFLTRMTQITPASPLWLISSSLSYIPECRNVSDPWDVLPILRAINNIPRSLHLWRDPIILPLDWNALVLPSPERAGHIIHTYIYTEGSQCDSNTYLTTLFIFHNEQCFYTDTTESTVLHRDNTVNTNQSTIAQRCYVEQFHVIESLQHLVWG